ncbi:flowering-promoting factor 1-like [Apium graveolens]|uniref:flowering-promoting factor 1-like n=1 Tax=Apium graveolens TaxID=4045 RepID=UPI003D7BE7C3
MFGVWVFKDGIIRRNIGATMDQQLGQKKVLVHLPSGELVSSYSSLQQMLMELGWVIYYGDMDLLQFRKVCSIDLISLPKDFHKFNSVYMYDIVVKNPNVFLVRDC